MSSEKGNYSICYIDIFRLFSSFNKYLSGTYYSRYLGRHSVPRTDSDIYVTWEYKEEESYLSEVV